MSFEPVILKSIVKKVYCQSQTQQPTFLLLYLIMQNKQHRMRLLLLFFKSYF